MNTSRDDEVVRRLELLGAVQPAPDTSGRAIDRARRALGTRPTTGLVKRLIMKRSFTTAAAALLAVSTVLAWHLTSPSSSSAEAAFADVQAAMKSPHSVTCRQTTQVEGKPDDTLRLFILDNGLWRAEKLGGTYTLSDNVKHRWLIVDPKKKEATLLEGVNTPKIDLYQTLKDLPADASARLLPWKDPIVKYPLVFEVKLRGQVFRVQADTKTRLPLRIESSGEDADGNSGHVVLDGIVFDKELDPKLFSFEVPAGYRLVTKGVAELPAPPRDAPRKDLTVKPGVGVGEVKFGMTREEVEKILGKPETIEEAPKGGAVTLNYYSHGLFVSVSKTSGVGMISCMAQKIILVRINDFPGKTDKGIALGATSAEVIRAYGEPGDKRDAGGSTSLSYPKLPAQFQFVNDQLVQILLTRPRPAK
jgi:outer membrane lipoprotein-sorting protein